MKKKTSLSEEDQTLFRQLMTGTRKIKQDTIVHPPLRKKVSEVPVKRLIQEQADASHYFSDEFQPLLNTEGAVKYVRSDVSHFELKKLRRGDYSPELFLDLHGLTQMQAKQELGALIAHAMVGTFLGILLAYGFISPLASVLRQKSAETTKMMQCVKITLLSNLT